MQIAPEERMPEYTMAGRLLKNGERNPAASQLLIDILINFFIFFVNQKVVRISQNI
jgi:hypothetical protein